MTTVTGRLIGGTPSRTEVTATLVDVTGARAVGYVADDQAEIVRPVTITPQSDGTWSAELTPNAQIAAAAGDTVWAVMEGRALDGTPVMTHILVPESGGPHWMGDLRVDLGDAPTGGSTVVYVPGPAGADGQDGTNGVDGAPGASAYELWLGEGGVGTEADFLDSLVGPSGTAEAQEYTDTALAAEVARSDSAYDPAGAAETARTAAVSAAATDAAAKAAAAQSTATSTAAADAAAKADAARSAAITAAATSAATLYLPNAIQTVDVYFAGASASSPRFFAHRGGGMVRPEHTMAAYRASAAQGFPLEVSVNVDASGELWCIHDTTMDRTTYRTGAVNTYTTEEVGQQVLTNGRTMLGQGWTDQPMVPLRQVLDEFLGKVIILLEPKGNDAVVPCQALLDTYYPHAPRSVVWKAHIGTASLPWAKSRGYRTWVYLDSGTTDATMDGKDSLVDYWGVQTTFTDTRIQQVVARGKPVFSWPVYRRSQVTRLTGLGVVGIMASDPRYVSTSLPQRTASRWDLQVKESGGTPTLDYDSTYALKWDDSPNAGWVYINAAGQSYGLGAYCPIAAGASGYRISFDMRFEGIPTLTTEHAGIYFGKVSDDAYRFGTVNTTGGYHMVMRANGQMQLNRHTAGVTTGTTIGTAQPTDAVVANQAMSFQLDVTPATVELRRTDGVGWTTGPIADTTYRGGYFGLSNGGITNLATKPHWRNLVITQL
ncbi:glycerophosphodiester phosphodiesterase [Streptomyces sp. NPDC059783]|uniref:glycerophosphodiester phosphodiesterase n=1 Tax=Streptomyces sp. NPDC059783 TaxID=3346944 RepID=UPI003647DC60